MLQTLLPALLSALLISAVSFAGAATFLLSSARMKKLMPLLLSLAAGAMLGNSLLHLLPHALEATKPAAIGENHEHHHHGPGCDCDGHDHDQAGTSTHGEQGHHHHDSAALRVVGVLLLGFFLLFGLDMILLSRHAEGEADANGVKPLGYLVLVSDGLENFIDGLLIGAAFMVSLPVGLATSLAVLIHEIPMELGDFAVLTHAGFGRKKALLLNLASALISVVGVLLAFVIGSAVTGFASIAAPLAAGAILYLATTGLLAQLRSYGSARQKLACFGMTLVGVVLMALILLLE